MATRTFASVADRVRPNVPGCPQPLILNTIREGAIRACEMTLAWRYQIPTFNLSPGIFEYTFTRPTNTDVHAIFSAIQNGTHLTPLTLDDALDQYPEWADAFSGLSVEELWAETGVTNSMVFGEPEFNEGDDPDISGQLNNNPEFVMPDAAMAMASEPRAVCQVSPSQFVVLPLPDNAKTYSIRMFVALKPSRDATGMDSVALDELEDAIYHYTLKQLFAMPRNEANWADYELASWHAKHLTFKLAERRARANLGNARGRLRVKQQSFGA